MILVPCRICAKVILFFPSHHVPFYIFFCIFWAFFYNYPCICNCFTENLSNISIFLSQFTFSQLFQCPSYLFTVPTLCSFFNYCAFIILFLFVLSCNISWLQPPLSPLLSFIPNLLSYQYLHSSLSFQKRAGLTWITTKPGIRRWIRLDTNIPVKEDSRMETVPGVGKRIKNQILSPVHY